MCPGCPLAKCCSDLFTPRPKPHWRHREKSGLREIFLQFREGMTTCQKVAPAEVWPAALQAQDGVLSQGCTRGAVLFMVLSEALLGDALHPCSKSMAMLTILPAAALQQVQLLQEQGEEQQDAPKQHICQGRVQRHASLVCPLLLSNHSSHTSAADYP